MNSNVVPNVNVISMPAVSAIISGTPTVNLSSSVLGSINSDSVNGWVDMATSSTTYKLPFKFSKCPTTVAEVVTEMFGELHYYQKCAADPTQEITWSIYCQKTSSSYVHITFKTKLDSNHKFLYKSVSSATYNIESYS